MPVGARKHEKTIRPSASMKWKRFEGFYAPFGPLKYREQKCSEVLRFLPNIPTHLLLLRYLHGDSKKKGTISLFFLNSMKDFPQIYEEPPKSWNHGAGNSNNDAVLEPDA
jgi:hypothetical protein